MRELGIDYYYSNDSQHVLFACYDLATRTIWISYKKPYLVVNLRVDSKEVIFMINVRADWMSSDDKGNLFFVNREESYVGCIRNGRIITKFICENPISVYVVKEKECILIGQESNKNICLMNYYGKILWEYKNVGKKVRKMGNCIMVGNHIYISDRFSHVIYQLTLDVSAEISCFWGTSGKPDCDDNKLCAPYAVEFSSRGILICDTLNGRILLVNNRKVSWQYGDNIYLGGEKALLWKPNYVQEIEDDSFFICDADNNNILIVNDKGDIKQKFSKCIIKRTEFKMPRSVLAKNNQLYIADTHHHRIIIWDIRENKGIKYLSTCKEGNFKFPRCINVNENSIVITDSGNDRILLFDKKFNLKKVYECLNYHGKRTFFSDPHDVIEDKGFYVVTDTGNNRVIKFDESGIVVWMYTMLKDPHKANITNCGYEVADKDSNCITFLDKNGKYIGKLTCLGEDRIKAPRFIGEFANYNWLIDDIDDDRRRISCLGHNCILQLNKVKSKLPYLIHSRWLTINENKLYISDTGNNRILEMSLEELFRRYDEKLASLENNNFLAGYD